MLRGIVDPGHPVLSRNKYRKDGKKERRKEGRKEGRKEAGRRE